MSVVAGWQCLWVLAFCAGCSHAIKEKKKRSLVCFFGVPVNNELLTGTVPVNKELFTSTLLCMVPLAGLIMYILHLFEAASQLKKIGSDSSCLTSLIFAG